jgi:hypothetical protein
MRYLLLCTLLLLASCRPGYTPRTDLEPGELDLVYVQTGTEFNSVYEDMKKYGAFGQAQRMLGPHRAETVIDRLGPLSVRLFYVAGDPVVYPSEYLIALVACDGDTTKVPANEWYIMLPDKQLTSIYGYSEPFQLTDYHQRSSEGFHIIVASFEFHCNGTVTQLYNGREVSYP